MQHQPSEITNRLQRLERFEDKWGLTLECLSAWIKDHGNTLQVSGELRLISGLKLPQRIKLVFACYDESNRVVSIREEMHLPESFYGFAAFSVGLPTLGYRITKALVYPTPF